MASRTAPARPAPVGLGSSGHGLTSLPRKPLTSADGRIAAVFVAWPAQAHEKKTATGRAKIMAEGAPPIYRRDRRRLPAPQRRRQIIDVATQLIADRGFWGVSMQDVADGCGLTVPGLLRHVESKVGLLIAVLEHRDVEDALSLRAHLGATEDEMPLDWATGYPAGVGLRRLCDATMRRNAIQPEIVRLFTVLAAESLEPAHPAHAYFARRQQVATAAYAALAEQLTDRPVELAGQIVAMMDGLQIQWLRNPETTDLVQVWRAAAEALFGPFAEAALA